MDIQTRKLEFIKTFLNLQNEDRIATLEEILYSKEERVEQNILPIKLEAFHNRIERSLEDSKNGNLISTKRLIAEIEKWD